MDREIEKVDSGWGGATFEEADRANEYEEARAEKYWADRGADEYVIRTDDELRTEGQER